MASKRQRIAARKAVLRAVQAGRLKRQPCEICGSDRRWTDAHHDDYTKPLEVRWLCKWHHLEIDLGRDLSHCLCGKRRGPHPGGLCRDCYNKRHREYIRSLPEKKRREIRRKEAACKRRHFEQMTAAEQNARIHLLRARAITYWRVKNGKIVKGPCEICGSKKALMHFDSLEPPYLVRWFCRGHKPDSKPKVRPSKSQRRQPKTKP